MKPLRAWFPRWLQASMFQRTCVITRATPGHWARVANWFELGSTICASKLVGKIDGIALPQRGGWIRQGQKTWTIIRDGKLVDMVSPIEGTASGINDPVIE